MSSDDEHFAAARRWFDHKSKLMGVTLGKAHDSAMHDILAYRVGGALDQYYYPNAILGTAVATMELSELPNEGSSNDIYRSYELVMFTKLPLDLAVALDETTEFGRVHASIDAFLNRIARLSEQEKLNPNETCEFSVDMEKVGGKCMVIDGYACHTVAVADRFGLLAIIEVFRSEMEFARKNGGATLIERLKGKGYYPYSDLDRVPVA